MQWLKVFVAGLVEIMWVTSMNHAHNIPTWIVTLILIALSFYLILSASKHLPVGTAYTVFVGMGAIGTVLVDIFIHGDTLSFSKVVLLILLIVGILGLQMTTEQEES
ncbi:DMT family transporter [Staphylococcus pettenkoferi]|uniref:DMT family transporter n=1 Tax=Staphylococcus pettenkoferi TaxID=170573 RepID=UPI00066B9550|nr:SMR family transporter [Staphylococcus pettenkoferi]MCI2803340.1 SMR family transporter [Staphylococcus pettenkoferi]MCY1572919.1 SMR family transporter [Staphylococcus pettenkoferi]MCY1578933.1 SMR family transporter [Staphylococcus pettenkoferi]MCY1584515.1 SMR family transporter [Staphylococcus pettenkoferi]MCY1615679.1 SMR family transporter [Staphylococcus pettenkoferi]